MKYFVVYLCIINALSFILMLIDKQKARKKRWRIPESTLMGVCAIGGSIGGLLGMYMVRHKTKHPKFFIGIPALFLLQTALMIFVYLYIL